MRVELAIVGAGTAGAALAARAASHGLSVALVERRPRGAAGARWINGVAGWTFDESGVSRPRGDELFGSGHAFHLIAGRGPTRVVVADHDVLEVDMRLLVTRLQDSALQAGAQLLDETRVTGFDGQRLSTTRGDVQARWFVDASGLAGARLLETPRVSRNELCVAAQEVRRLDDPKAAAAFFAEHGVPLGDTLCFTGVEGGFSVVNLRVVGDRVSLLTGSIPGEGRASGREMLSEFVAQNRWIGSLLFGGARAIPLRRPVDRLARGNVALLGDAGCQVFSAHGSGIGAGLLAARLLADRLAGGGDLHGYAVDWHRRYGALFASYAAFRRFSQSLDAEGLRTMMRLALIDDSSARAGLEQRLPAPSLGLVARALRTARSEPRLFGRLARAAAESAAARVLYASYPEDPSALPDWSARATRWFG